MSPTGLPSPLKVCADYVSQSPFPWEPHTLFPERLSANLVVPPLCPLRSSVSPYVKRGRSTQRTPGKSPAGGHPRQAQGPRALTSRLRPGVPGPQQEGRHALLPPECRGPLSPLLPALLGRDSGPGRPAGSQDMSEAQE